MKRLVIIGGSGFVGKNLGNYLTEKNISVISLNSKECNLLDEKSSQKLSSIIKEDDVVVFASALTPDKGKDEHAFMKNVSMAYNSVAFFEKTKCTQFIYISSDAVYGDEFNPIKESTPATAPSLYGMAHRSREMIFESATLKAKTPYLILRPCALYGLGDTHNSYGPNRFIKTAKLEKKISLFGEGKEKRDHLYIFDFCSIIYQAVLNSTVGVLNACTGTSVSFFEVASILKNEIPDIEIHTSKQNGGVIHRHFDATMIKKEFSKITFTSLKDGISQILENN